MEPFKPFHIVLVEPEIPPNTGNIARLCGATRSVLHLVGKLGFATDDRTLKRAGLDYWHTVDIRYWSNLEELTATFPEGRFIYTSKKAARSYVAMNFREGDFIVFGKETRGLPEELLDAHPAMSIRIPIFGEVRSINLATSAGIILYEALRQTGKLVDE
ncbi:MAG TPA: tRNA (cytidine(34)-2'-O)-methyltransferase [Geobacteraceae bacterium]|nr:tRNA (cytidine(34)-2'-O)-methyltransferase [Geobacteraceae bacterium]